MKDMKEKTMGKFAYSISLVFKVVLCLAGAVYLQLTGGDDTTLFNVALAGFIFLPLAIYAESQT
jgi:hypothetical protein